MSNPPFGFSPRDPDDPDRPAKPDPAAAAGDPFAAMFGALGADPGDLGAALQQLGRMLQWQGGPVNWDLARESARQLVAARGDRSVSASERRAVDEVVRLGDLWLNEATGFSATGASGRAWSRAEWVEGTLPAWKQIVEPVAERVADAMGRTMPAEVAQAAGPLLGMVRQLGVSMWGGQVGQALGTLAGEVTGCTDVGVPLGPEGVPVLLSQNVRAFGEGLGVDERDVSLYLALRELAHLRLYAHAPWLRPHVVALVDEFARGIEVDTSRIESAITEIDPSRPEQVRELLEGGLFQPTTTPAQQAALDRLETALALVEGWVDDVVTEASRDRLPSAGALRETVRRRRATGGPAEQTFATLVGLELRPRRLREAADFWAAVRQARGDSGRDALWSHPDLLPAAADLADPEAFLRRAADDGLDLSALDDPGDESGEPPSGPAASG